MTPPDRPPSAHEAPSATNLPSDDKAKLLVDLSDGGKIFPLTFPKPQLTPSVITDLAGDIRTSGQAVSDIGSDITAAWGALPNCYESSGDDAHLYAVLDPVSSDGSRVMFGTNRIANALEDFADTAESIRGRWDDLTSDANTFRSRVADEGEDWRDSDGWFSESSNVEDNDALIRRGERLIQEYEEAERDCANRINARVDGRTRFEAMPSDTEDLDEDVFYHGHADDLSDLTTEWDLYGPGTDYPWFVDVGASVWDFGVQAVEGTGAMLGLHSSEGWLNASWGDAFFEYHEDNIQSALGLVGMYDAESDSYGWGVSDEVGQAWRDLAHSVVPWQEWGERPGYVIGTALLNIGATVGGAVLTATGVGAPVGVALMAWRGMAILDGMGSGRGGSGGEGADGTDLDTDLGDGTRFGDQGAPVVPVNSTTFDPGDFTPDQLAGVRDALAQVHDLGPGGGSGRPAPPSDGTEGTRPTRPTTRPSADEDTSPSEASRPHRNDDEADFEAVETSNRWGTDAEESGTGTSTENGRSQTQERDASEPGGAPERSSTSPQENPSSSEHSSRPQPAAGDRDGSQGSGATRAEGERSGSQRHDDSNDDGGEPSSTDRHEGRDNTHNNDRTGEKENDSTSGEQTRSRPHESVANDPRTQQIRDGDDVLARLEASFDQPSARGVGSESPQAQRFSARYAESHSPLQNKEGFFREMEAEADRYPTFRMGQDGPDPWSGDAGTGRPGPEGGGRVLETAGAPPKADAAGAHHSSGNGSFQHVRADDSTGRGSDGDRAGQRARQNEGEAAQAGAKGILAAGMTRAAVGGRGPDAQGRGNSSPTNSSHSTSGGRDTPNTSRRDGTQDGQGSRTSSPETGTRTGPDSGAPNRSGNGDTPTGRRDNNSSNNNGNGNRPDTGPRRDSDNQPDSGPRRDNTDQQDTGPRRDGTDSKNDTPTPRRDDNQDNRDSSGKKDRDSSDSNSRRNSDSESPAGRKMSTERIEAWRKAEAFLKDKNLGTGKEFRNRFTDLVNKHPFLRDAYHQSDGKVFSKYMEIHGEKIPSLYRDPGTGKWKMREELPPPAPIDYLKDTFTGSRRGIPEKVLRKLDTVATVRNILIKSHTPLDTAVQKLKTNFNSQKTQGSLKNLEKAREVRKPVAFMKNKIAEKFGDLAAKEAVKSTFDGKTKARVIEVVRDENGNKVRREVEKTLPKMDDKDLIPPSEKAPKNGNDQFDQIWKNEDGEFVIAEAKSSLKTELGERKIRDQNNEPKRVSQGSREYFDDILKEMKKRGGKEAALAEEIREALDNNKVHYVEARGNPDGNRYKGNSLSFFDILRSR